MSRPWWKDAVIYQIYIRSFQDSNGDGIGDIGGITSRADYLKTLGIDAIWLTPFLDSPNVDNGYDVRDYYSILTDFGTMDDWKAMLAAMHSRGIRVIMDMVVNHTSDQHRWFRESLDKASPYRKFYYWRQGKALEPPNNWTSFFSESAWTRPAGSDEYYLHLFARQQPDLNWSEPEVRQAVADIMTFWLEQGVDGFRLDVIGLIGKEKGLPDGRTSGSLDMVGPEHYANRPAAHAYLRDIRARLDGAYSQRVYIGETTYATTEDAFCYTCGEPELDMILHSEWMEVDSEGDKWNPIPFSVQRLKQAVVKWQTACDGQLWNCVFLGNHDKPRMLSRFGCEGANRQKSAKLLALLLLSLRGTPIIYQGDELGMTNTDYTRIEQFDDVETHNFWRQAIEELQRDPNEVMKTIRHMSRDNARTPMQWADAPNAGFTNGKPWLGVNSNYHTINAAAAMRDPQSVYTFYKQLLSLRRHNEALREGAFRELTISECPNVFSYLRFTARQTLWVVLNWGDQPVEGIHPPQGHGFRPLLSNEGMPSPSVLEPWEATLWAVE